MNSAQEAAVLVPLMTQWRRPTAVTHERTAARCIDRGHYWLIPTRDRSGPYMLRMWLSPPVLKRDGGRERFHAGGADLLHYFFRGDDDQALHDHPFDFETVILAGGYIEHLPPASWDPNSLLGPAWDEHTVMRVPGDRVSHAATDLHCVGQVEPGTFTRFRAGRTIRPWGFHPPGREWINADDYLRVNA